MCTDSYYGITHEMCYDYMSSGGKTPLQKYYTRDELKSLCVSPNFMDTLLKKLRQTMFGVANIIMITRNK